MALFADIDQPASECIDCGAALAVLASRSRCRGCEEAEAQRVIDDFCAPAAQVRADIAAYADDGCWDLEP